MIGLGKSHALRALAEQAQSFAQDSLTTYHLSQAALQLRTYLSIAKPAESSKKLSNITEWLIRQCDINVERPQDKAALMRLFACGLGEASDHGATWSPLERLKSYTEWCGCSDQKHPVSSGEVEVN